MGKVIWAPSALEDVNSIAEYIARDSVDRAALFVVRLFEATDRLQEFPLSGRVIPEIGEPSCREIIYGSYRIISCIVSPIMRSGLLELGMVHKTGSRNNNYSQ